MNTESIIRKIKQALGYSSDRQLAAALGLSPQDFANKKLRGTLILPVIGIALDNNININWLLSEKGSSSNLDQIKYELLPLSKMLYGELLVRIDTKLFNNKKVLLPETKRTLLDKLHEYYWGIILEEINKNNNVINIKPFIKSRLKEIDNYTDTTVAISNP